VWLRVRGTGRWVLRLDHILRRGRYVIRADAVDWLHHRAQATGASTQRIRIR
jgi:hypothetical protein